jgi:hypothetical protein
VLKPSDRRKPYRFTLTGALPFVHHVRWLRPPSMCSSVSGMEVEGAQTSPLSPGQRQVRRISCRLVGK